MNKYLFFILFLFPVHLFAQEADTLIVEEEPHYDILQELRTESHNGGQVILDSDTPIEWEKENFYRLPDSNLLGQFVRLQHRQPKGNAE